MMDTAPEPESAVDDEPPRLRFLRRLVIVLTTLLFAAMIVVIVAIVVKASRFDWGVSSGSSSSATPFAISIDLRPGERLAAASSDKGHVLLTIREAGSERARIVAIDSSSGNLMGEIEVISGE